MLVLICLNLLITCVMTFNTTKQPYGILMCKELHDAMDSEVQHYNAEQLLCTAYNRSTGKEADQNGKRSPDTKTRVTWNDGMFIIKGNFTYEKGVQSCKDVGGTIADIYNGEENTAAVARAQESGLQLVAIGVHKVIWRWVYTKDEVDVIVNFFWAAGHPDPHNSYCAMSKQVQYKWISLYWNSFQGVLCKRH